MPYFTRSHALRAFALALCATLATHCTRTQGTSAEAIQPPLGLAYTRHDVACTKGQAIPPNTPTYSGGVPSRFSSNKPLPPGLQLSEATGTISGTPTTVSAPTTFTIQASNSAGSISRDLRITVNDTPPADLTYETSSAVYKTHTPIPSNKPRSVGGDVLSYTITPSLPAGLSFSATTGIISGMPTVVSPSQDYVVEAFNSGGSCKHTLRIAVLDGSLHTDIYAIGCGWTGNRYGLGYWLNSSWTELPTPDQTTYCEATDIRIHQGTDYILGNGQDSWGRRWSCVWIRGKRMDLPSPFKNSNIRASRLHLADQDVYIAGECANAYGNRVAGYWLNGIWMPLPTQYFNWDSWATGVLVHGSDCYVAGTDSISSTVQVAGYWKNGTWTRLDSPNPDLKSRAHDIGLHGNDLLLVGCCAVDATRALAGYWKNGAWTGLPLPQGAQSSEAFSLCVDGTDLYIAGLCLDAAGNRIPGYWKNHAWIALPAPPDPSPQPFARSIRVIQGDVYVNGLPLFAPGYWKNGQWVPLPLPANCTYGNAGALAGVTR